MDEEQASIGARFALTSRLLLRKGGIATGATAYVLPRGVVGDRAPFVEKQHCWPRRSAAQSASRRKVPLVNSG
jgi:hypothetical protein